DDAHHLGGDRDVFAVGVAGVDGDGVTTAGQFLAGRGDAVPDDAVGAGLEGKVLGIDDVAIGVLDGAVGVFRWTVNAIDPGRPAVDKVGGGARDGHGLADIAHGLGVGGALGRLHHRLEELVGLQLLFDRGELDKLLGELVGVQRL